MNLSYKYRLYPSKVQKLDLERNLDICRHAYNFCLDHMNYVYEMEKRTPSRFEVQGMLPILKEALPEFKSVNAKALQMVVQQLYANLRVLSKCKKAGRRVGRLRFKGRGWYKTLTFNQRGFKITTDGKLELSKIGCININLHRRVEGRIKQVKVKHEVMGKWFAILCVEQTPLEAKKKTTNPVGIDLGLTDFAVDSEGKKTKHPFNIKMAERCLAKAQKDLARKKKGSKNRQKARLRVARVYDKVTNRRRDFLHKLSRYYVNTYDFIAIEDLDVKGLIEMQRNSCKAMDGAWRTFADMLSYKAENAGDWFVKVEPRGTTQECSNCGAIVPKGLWDRIHRCPTCGFTTSRDHNSALNIKYRGLLSVGQGLPDFKPVEIEALHQPRTVDATLVVEAGSSHHS